jgi:hypothetical protein
VLRFTGDVWLTCVAVFAPAAAAAAIPPPAYVRAGATKEGQGFLMTKLGKCFLVTAAHVLDNHVQGEVVGAGDPAVRGEARLVAKDIAADVAVLQVTGPLESRCGSDYIKGISEDDVTRQARAVVPSLYENGRLLRGAYDTLVVDVDSRYLELALSGSGAIELSQGLSGGIVSINDLPAGMLLRVEGDHGEALRYDALMETVFTLLKAPLPAAPPAVSIAVAGREANLAAAVVNWSAPPVQPEFATSSLVLPQGPQIWKVSLATGPVSVDVRLAGTATHSIRYVELTRGEAPAEQLIRDYEVSTSVDGITWFLVQRGEFAQDAPRSAITFAPRLARFIRVRMLDSFDVNEKIGALGRIIVR